MVRDVNSWGEFKKILTELKDPEVKETFYNIVIDTADIAYNYCEKYCVNMASDENHQYETVADIPFGKGYKLVMAEFDECIRKILQMGYGLLLISHAQDKVFTDEDGNEYNKIVPTIENKGRLVCERTCDIIGYSRSIQTEEGSSVKLFLRGTPRFVAGSRFKYIPSIIDFNYDSLVKAIHSAIDQEAAEHDGKFVTEERVNVHVEQAVYDIAQEKEQFQNVVSTLINKNQANGDRIKEVIEKYLGKNKKVTECTQAQAEMVHSIVEELKELI